MVDQAQNLVDAISKLAERHGFHLQSNSVTVNGQDAEIEVIIKSNPPDLNIQIGQTIGLKEKLGG